MPKTPVAIVSAGAVTSVGLTAASTCAAIRASLDGFEETDFVDTIGERIVGARVPDEALGLDSDQAGSTLGGTGKLAAMFVKAATECVRGAGGIDAARTALFLIGPETTRPGVSLDKLHECFSACEQAVGKAFHPASQITQIGGPGLAAALDLAGQLLSGARGKQPGLVPGTSAEPIDAVLVAGLDSYLNTDDVNDALVRGRLLTSNDSDGYIPGEAAACVLVTRIGDLPSADAAGDPHRIVLQLGGVGLAAETQTLDIGRAGRGVALGAAMRKALSASGLHAHEIHWRLSDTSAESYFFEDASYAWSRVLRMRSPADFRLTTPSNRVGHIGAAMGPLLLTLALDAARKQWGSGANSLLQLSSASAPRGAVVVRALQR